MKPKPEYRYVVELLSDVGVGRLAHFDGCVCSEFNVRNVNILIRCGRGGYKRGIWVSAMSSVFTKDAELRAIAKEVQKQVKPIGGSMNIHARLGVFPDQELKA